MAPSAERISSPAAARWHATAGDSRRSRTRSRAAARWRRTTSRVAGRMPLGNVSLNGRRPTRHFSGKRARLQLPQVRDDGPEIRFRLRVGNPGFTRPSTCTTDTLDLLPRAEVGGRYTSAPRHMNRGGITPMTSRIRRSGQVPAQDSGRRRTDAARSGIREPQRAVPGLHRRPGVRPTRGATPMTSNVSKGP